MSCLGTKVSTRLAENSVAYLRNVLCRPDTCRSLTLENQFVAVPGRSTTGQYLPFPVTGLNDKFIPRQALHITNETPAKMSSPYWLASSCSHLPGAQSLSILMIENN